MEALLSDLALLNSEYQRVLREIQEIESMIYKDGSNWPSRRVLHKAREELLYITSTQLLVKFALSAERMRMAKSHRLTVGRA